MKKIIPEKVQKWAGWVVFLVLIGTAGVTYPTWWPRAQNWVTTVSNRLSGRNRAGKEGAEHADHDGHADHEGHADHNHGGPSSSEAIETLKLSDQAKQTLGLTKEYIKPVTLSDYQKSITVPAIVVERPGRSKLHVATPMTGVITHVHAIPGETVKPGELLFQIRLTHEDLVRLQTEFLKTLGELTVEKKELARLESLAKTGAIAGKFKLEPLYAVEKLEALAEAQREGLRLHGLSEAQVERIEKEKRLLRELRIPAPSRDHHGQDGEELDLTQHGVFPVSHQKKSQSPLILDQLYVHKGEAVMAGKRLCTVVDYTVLYIEGLAFEQDGPAVIRALEQGWPITALFLDGDNLSPLENLSIAFLANSVDAQSRALKFYVLLENELLSAPPGSPSAGYVVWKYRPGQRLQLQIPVEKWSDQIVLPVDAVAVSGAQSFVFRQNGRLFEQVPVTIKHRDQTYVVIDRGGDLHVGDRIAMHNAHQLQIEIQNNSGGAVDPHAGHTH